MWAFRSSTALLAATFLSPVIAHAQSGAPTGVTAHSAGSGPQVLEEVVVTAQRREERLKDVPIAITAITGSQLAASGITNTLQLTAVTPGLNFVVNGAYAQPTIRGIGTGVTGAGADANVSLYIDGVYQPSQVANAFELSNIERIEVLKGPQGTLFGRNATGGAISITTLAPSFSTHGQVSAGFGSFNEYKLSGYLTGPINDKVAGDLSLLYKHDDGYVRNTLLNKDTGKQQVFSARAKLLYRPTDNLSFTLAGAIERNSNNAIYLTKPINNNNVALRTAPSLYFPPSQDEINTDTDPIAASSTKSVSLTGRYRTSYGAFSSITSFENLKVKLLVDSDVTSIASSSNLTTLPERTFSQELNFASAFPGRANFISGVYYYSDDSTRRTVNSRGVAGPVTQDFTVGVKTDAEAIYGELNYDVTDAVRIIGGLRYSTERKQANGTYALGGTAMLHGDERWDALTPRASIRYRIDNRSNAYFTFSRGFKSGSFNTTTLTQPYPVSPEFVNAYEVGYKFSSGRLIANASAFYYDYSDIQVGVQTNVGGVSAGVLQNAATAKIYGVDGDVTAQLTDNWRLRLGAAYTHATYGKYTGALLTTPRVGGGNTQTPGDASGNELIRSPEWMINGTLSYNKELSYGRLESSATVSYNGGFFWDPRNRVKQDPYTLINANLAWISPDKKYRLEAWAKNLTDVTYYYYVSVSTTGDSGSFQRPRTFGVSLTRYFE